MENGGGDGRSPCTVVFRGHKPYSVGDSALIDTTSSAAISPVGAWVASGSKDRGIRFWNPKDAQAQLILSPADGLFATGSGDFLARICESTFQDGFAFVSEFFGLRVLIW
ncbi:uncharacterized protein EI90DRAFT_3016347 [Cantharellus anzutake]|uniref:uncharacterized protein n=1 Tax=Cantharellus anzutake TaxID=1750568 RepID=UPI001905B193|nr:uncharacterized protein EI90DRAFT_3016347 [Cantharellus anzutake]KAF8331326.1 hypothetical protein EI90DRAFT_3016347 [Cantharellus anzutake]